jgi:hypothetical protein
MEPGSAAEIWMDGFLNNLGQVGKHGGPNTGICIKVPAR